MPTALEAYQPLARRGGRYRLTRIMQTRLTALCADPTTPRPIEPASKSTDFIATTTPAAADIHALVYVRCRLIASTNNDVHVSTDGGLTWQPLRPACGLGAGSLRNLPGAQRPVLAV
jgi:hypothetical protein